MADNTIVEIRGSKTLPHEFDQSFKMIIGMLQENIDGLKELKKRHPEFDCRFGYKVID